MANETEKNEKYKNLTDGGKYRWWKNRLKVAGEVIISATLGIGLCYGIYKVGKYAGAYELLEEIYDTKPDVASALTELDPAFFAMLKN